MKIVNVMDNNQFTEYLNTICDDYHNLAVDLLSKYYIFAIDTCAYKKKLRIAKIILRYFLNDLQLTDTEGFSINILSHSDVTKLSEVLNSQLGTNYKPTFLTDVTNYKSIRETF